MREYIGAEDPEEPPYTSSATVSYLYHTMVLWCKLDMPMVWYHSYGSHHQTQQIDRYRSRHASSQE